MKYTHARIFVVRQPCVYSTTETCTGAHAHTRARAHTHTHTLESYESCLFKYYHFIFTGPQRARRVGKRVPELVLRRCLVFIMHFIY